MQRSDPRPHSWRTLKDIINLQDEVHEVPLESIHYPIPSTGVQTLLVILVDFPEQAGRFSGQAWQEFFFGQQGFSDYYREVSRNQLRYVGDVIGMSGNAPVKNAASTAYVRLPNPVSYYANNQAGRATTFPQNASGIVYDTLRILDRAGFDFASYANAHTSMVENVVVVFAGQNVRDTHDNVNSLMPTAYSLPEPYITQGKQRIRDFTFCPEQRRSGEMASIGVCVHEHGHGLGMFDLYDLCGSIVGVGRHDVMGYGIEPDAEGFRHPTHFGAFSKEFLGWSRFPMNPLPYGTYEIALPPAEMAQPDQFIKLYPHGGSDSDEYFLLENRQPYGFDSDWQVLGLSPGLIIWHIDRRIALNRSTIINNVVNTPSRSRAEHCGVMIVEADGSNDMVQSNTNFGSSSDTWTAGRVWGDNTFPSLLWDGQESGLSVAIQQQNGDGSLNLKITGWPQQST